MNKKYSLGIAAFLASITYGSQIYPGTVYIRDKQHISPENLLEQKILSIKEQVTELNERFGYKLSGEDLVLLTRIVYKEAGNDRKAKTQQDLETGWAGVVWVIRNRYTFNKTHQTTLFGVKENNLANIVRAKNQFQPVQNNPRLFDPKTFYDQKGNFQVAYGNIPQKKAKQIYRTVISVLKEETEDPTKGALFFHADYAKKDERKKTVFYLNKTPCKTTAQKKINTHLFTGTTCPLEKQDFF